MGRPVISLLEGVKKFGRFLGKVQAEVILFIFYFLILTPYSSVLRLFGSDPLRLRYRGDTNWQGIRIEKSYPADLKRQS
ncbi:MAG: hypothetical protein HRF51_06870 [bacterium]|jgi:hypothetical protein